MVKMLMVTVCAACSGVLGAQLPGGQIVYDNLGPTNSVMLGGGAIGLVKGDDVEQGLQFSPLQTVRLTTLDLAISRVVSGQGPGSALVQLRLDADNAPGAVMESWTTPTIGALDPSIRQLTSQLGSTVAAGQKYWITIGRAPGSDFGGAWHFVTQPVEALEVWRKLPNSWSSIYRRGYGTRVSGAIMMPGDANEDGRITSDDYALLDRGITRGLHGWNNGDFNGDAKVDLRDRVILDVALVTQQGGSLLPTLLAEREAEFGSDYVSQLVAAVPEPGMGLMLVGCAGLLVRRRRR